MLDTMKKITGFFGMSENPSENLRVFRLFYTFCSITHIVFLVTFIFMGITALSIASVLSVACYMICLSATYFKKYYYTILLAFLEIISFSILSVVYLGWDMNIQYFMICIIPLGFFFPFKRIECPLIATILAATLYVLLLIHSNKVEPLFNLENYQFVANTIKYTSLVTCLIGVILLSYLFSFSVRKKQAQLKHANKVLERIANTDALTGLANRRSMVKSLGVALRNLRTDSIPATVVIG
ncbi:MAG: GGDEF domain-containing protein, partial [Oscillospiraceae bacterium]